MICSCMCSHGIGEDSPIPWCSCEISQSSRLDSCLTKLNKTWPETTIKTVFLISYYLTILYPHTDTRVKQCEINECTKIMSCLISGFSSISYPHPSWNSCQVPGPTPPPTTWLIDSLFLLFILPFELLLNPITNYILAAFMK